MARQRILTDRQAAALRLFAAEEDLAHAYVLSGGAALAAFYLHHRLSDDLDFFTKDPVDLRRVQLFIGTLKETLHAENVQLKTLYDRRIFTLLFPHEEELKMEFTRFPYEPLEEPVRKQGVLVESLRDIAAGKLAAILDRFEPKDYVDLYVLLREGMPIKAIWNDVQQKFGLVHGPMQVGSALMRARNLAVLPNMLKPIARGDIAQFFENVAKSLRDETVEN